MSEHSAHDRSPVDMPYRVSPDELPEIRRDLFMDALAVAREDHDPCSAWDSFCETAWNEAALAFGFVEREPWPGAPTGEHPPGLNEDQPPRDSDDDS